MRQVSAATEKHSGPQWFVRDLAELDLSSEGISDGFDGVLGNDPGHGSGIARSGLLRWLIDGRSRPFASPNRSAHKAS